MNHWPQRYQEEQGGSKGVDQALVPVGEAQEDNTYGVYPSIQRSV